MGLLVVGSVAFDSVRTPAGVRENVLGGSATYFSLAASLFTKVRLVAVVGEDFGAEHRRVLEEKSVDITGLRTASGRTFRWSGEYGADLNVARTLDTQLNVFADFKPELSPSHRKTETVFLANIDPELQSAVLDQVESPRIVAADTMNFWIEGKRDALVETLRRVDILIINDGEARLLSREGNLLKAAEVIRSYGPEVLVIKRGEHGVLMFDGSSTFAIPAYPLSAPVDPTGAGDTFAGGFVGYLADSRRRKGGVLRQAAVVGTVLASFNVEDFSLDRLRRLTKAEVLDRYREFEKLTRFDGLPGDP